MNANHGSSKRGRRAGLESPLPTASSVESTRQPFRCITLLTDFGLLDAYVGVMKGVVASISPSTTVIDLCHNIEAQDVRAAAFLLASSFAYFPPGTIHVVVVDPTVGSKRRALCVQSGPYFFIGPDNGALSLASYRAGRPKIYALENREYFLETQSRTFHGRDIFAPVAAHLSKGVPIDSFGPKVRSMKRMRFPVPVTLRGPSLKGEVVLVDRFGNLITNIDQSAISKVFPQLDKHRLTIICNEHRIFGLSETYSDVASGVACALFGSYNFMEIAVREGNASATLGIKRGEKVMIELAG
jgi:S-adenosylmethionine hydrolase